MVFVVNQAVEDKNKNKIESKYKSNIFTIYRCHHIYRGHKEIGWRAKYGKDDGDARNRSHSQHERATFTYFDATDP